MSGFLQGAGNVASGLLMGPDADRLQTSEKVVRSVLTLLSKDPIAAHAMFSNQNQQAIGVMSSPEFQQLAPAEQAKLVPGFKLPGEGGPALPPVPQTERAKFDTAKGTADTIESQKALYDQALQTGDPQIIASALAGYRRSFGQSVNGPQQVAELADTRKAFGASGLPGAGASLSAGPGGVGLTGVDAPRQAIPLPGSAPRAGAPAASGRPALSGGASAQPAGLPITDADVPTLDQASRQQGGPPGLILHKMPNGEVIPMSPMQMSDGSVQLVPRSTEEAQRITDSWTKEQDARAKENRTRAGKVLDALEATQGVKDALESPLLDKVFTQATPANGVGDGLSYSVHQFLKFHSPVDTIESSDARKWEGLAQHALAQMAQGLGMRAGPYAIQALLGSLYSITDSAETVRARLSNLTTLKEGQLRAQVAHAIQMTGDGDIGTGRIGDTTTPTPTATPTNTDANLKQRLNDAIAARNAARGR